MKTNPATIHISHVEFARDLGGIETKDGLVVVNHQLYRTSKLTKVKAKQIQKIQDKLNTKTIIDLRTTDEVIYKPDQAFSKAKYVNLPVLGDYDNPVVRPKTATKVLKRLMNRDGGVVSYMTSIYRKLISSDQAISNYQLFLKELLATDDAIIWHCTQGKDRTGIASAILLMALGVDEQVIIDDYLRYNKKHRFKRLMIALGVSIFFFSIKKAIALHNLIIARREYIEAAFDEIHQKYHDIDTYLTETLQISQKEIDLLRSKFLQSKME